VTSSAAPDPFLVQLGHLFEGKGQTVPRGTDPAVAPPSSEEAVLAPTVPRGTVAKLEQYDAMLREANAKFNLVAASTLPDLWTRHFLDSAQLWPLLPPQTRTLVDLGSGAGFPGLVLAIMGVPEVHLIEATGKKATFLREVATELALNVTVHTARIEKVRDLPADVVTARALTALPELMSLAKPFLKKESCALFLKGEKAEAELTGASKYWTFTCQRTLSLTSPSGVILKISDLKVLRAHDPKRHK